MSDEPSSAWRRRGTIALPVLVHAVLCLANLFYLDRSPLLRYLTVDLAAYDRWARAIAAGD